MKRKEDWPELLAAFIDSRRTMPFAWGVNDCCLFSCDAVLAMTGVDLAKEYRGNYATALGAMRSVKPLGGVEGAFERACALEGFAEVRVVMVHRGDAVSTMTNHGPAIGICLGEVAAFVGRNGLEFISINNCRAAWQIR